MKILANLLRVTAIVFFVAQATAANAGSGNGRENNRSNRENNRENDRDDRKDDKKAPKPGKDKDDKEPTGAPIDGGASLLLAGGFAYVVRRINKARRKAV